MQMVGVTFTPAKNRHMEVLVYTSQKRAYGGVTFTVAKIGHMRTSVLECQSATTPMFMCKTSSLASFLALSVDLHTEDCLAVIL